MLGVGLGLETNAFKNEGQQGGHLSLIEAGRPVEHPLLMW